MRGFWEGLIAANALRVDAAHQKTSLRKPIDYPIKRAAVENGCFVLLYRLMQLRVCEAGICMRHQVGQHDANQLRASQSARRNKRVDSIVDYCSGRHKRKEEAI